MLNPDNREDVVTHDHEISYILSKFDEDFIYNTIIESLANKLKYFRSWPMPNLISEYEKQFATLLNEYPMFKEEILAKRNEVYENIIRILCDTYQLVYDDFDSYTIYTSLLYMYDLLVSNFTNRALEFFVTYITREKSALFKTLGLSDLKKNKDISTTYSKKVFQDTELSVISSNIERVLSNICEQDIPFEIYVSLIYDKKVADHINTVLKPVGNFFRDYIRPIIKTQYSIEFISEVRLALCGLNQRNKDFDTFLLNQKSIKEEV